MFSPQDRPAERANPEETGQLVGMVVGGHLKT
jgi:hypothetical protein